MEKLDGIKELMDLNESKIEPMKTTFQATITLLVQHCLDRKRTGEEREALIEYAMKLGEGVDLMHRKWIECQCDLEQLQDD
jgi:SMC interacting uncharacterized protein involved in chromosome segregation